MLWDIYWESRDAYNRLDPAPFLSESEVPENKVSLVWQLKSENIGATRSSWLNPSETKTLKKKLSDCLQAQDTKEDKPLSSWQMPR